MMKSTVVLLPCSSYQEDTVYKAVKQGIDLLGGLQQFIKTDEKILVKPNLLSSATPDKAITTHPSVFGALLRCLREEGYASVTYGDSPGSPVADLEKTVEIAGLKAQAERYKVPMGDFSGAETINYPEGSVCRKFVLCHAVNDADAIISVCKMKTHALENITGAVKNQYGCIYAANKAVGHAKYPNSQSFANMLIDLNKHLAVRLFLMDGIMAMEGNGPASGTPTPMNVILLSADPVALDSVFAHLVDLDPRNVPTCVSGAKMGLGRMNDDEICVLTPHGELTVKEAAAQYGNPKFDVKRTNPIFWRVRALLPKLRRYHDKPVVDLNKCIGCGICQEACPAEGKAVHSGHGEKAQYDYTKCIRCYCCQEMCPAKAISKR